MEVICLGKKFLTGRIGFGGKGFIITVDAFLSVSLVLLFALLSFYYLSSAKLESWNSVDLRNIVSDEAAVLQKSLVLENAVRQASSDEVLYAINSSPSGYCFDVTIFSSSLSTVLHSVKTGCTATPTQVYSVERSLVVPGDSSFSFYVARVTGWSK